ncbi:MAG: DUF4139 domain-containing protein [Ignavibacteriales bacterium]|nr:DUF4139 domain-containing protein [Ignavibacteriales bacterium]
MFTNFPLRFFLVLLFTGTMLFAQDPQVKSTAITIYNQNLGVVKETRTINFPQLTSSIFITDVAQLIDPTTAKFSFNGTVLEQNYKYDLVSMDKILARYLDRDVQLIGKTGELIEGTLLSSFGNQVVLKKKDGGLLMLPNIGEYRINVESLPSGLITKPTLQCLATVPKTGVQDVELSYQTGGMNWHAEYVATLDKSDKKLDLNAWVSIENQSGTGFANADIKLIAGDINRIRQQPMYMAKSDRVSMVQAATIAGEGFEERAFFEYHIYELQRKATVANNETKQISLFEKNNINIVKKYLYTANGNSGEEQKADVVVSFDNKDNNNLGVPMPKGKVRIFKEDGKSVEFVGEDLIDHTSKNATVNLKVGKAFDVNIKETETENRRISDRVYEGSYKVHIRNTKSEDVTVEIKRGLYGFWKVVKSSLEYEKADANTITFKIPVKAGEEAEFTYTVRFEN